MNKTDSGYVLCWAKKVKAIQLLGGKCSVCGTDDLVVMEFHHVLPGKEAAMNRIRTLRWSRIMREVERCVVVCSNCHSGLHVTENPKDGRRAELKVKLLEYKGVSACEECGHTDKKFASLGFHHRYASAKEHEMYVVAWGAKGKHNDLTEMIQNELDKCDVLCRNCHVRKHIDMSRFEMFRTAVMDRVQTHKELARVDRGEIRKLYLGGMKQIEIVRRLGCSKAIVSMVVNEG